MNLLAIASGAIGAVNPFSSAQVQVSLPPTTNADGSRTPNYTTIDTTAQVQAMTFGDLRQVEGLNLNGTRRAMYVNGAFNGVVRSQLKGGDLVTLTDGPNAGTWLVALVLEQWPDWCKLAVTLQDGS